MQDGYIAMQVAQDSDTKICRMSVTRIMDGISQLEFEYLIGRRGALERRSEIHQLGLFASAQMHNAFTNAGLSVDYDAEGLSGRGLYVASKGKQTA
jgi:hypothetical protein